MYQMKVEYKSVKFDVVFQTLEGNDLVGKITGPKKTIKFRWSKANHTRPWVGGADYRNRQVIDWVVGILDAAVDDTISDNHPGGSGRPIDEEYISRMIVKGHTRVPCWRRVGNGRILIKACVVNEAKLTPEELRDAHAEVGVMNALARMRGEPVSHKDAVEYMKKGGK